MITIPIWGASLPSSLLPLCLYTPRRLEDANQGARLGFQVFQDTLSMAGLCHQARAPGSCRIRNIKYQRGGRHGKPVFISVQQGFPLQRGMNRDDTWELLFLLGVRVPAQGLGIHWRLPPILDAIIHARAPVRTSLPLPLPSGRFCSRFPSTLVSLPAYPKFWFLFQPQSWLQAFPGICPIFKFPFSSLPLRPICPIVNSR